jgi:hypothetical protein
VYEELSSLDAKRGGNPSLYTQTTPIAREPPRPSRIHSSLPLLPDELISRDMCHPERTSALH